MSEFVGHEPADAASALPETLRRNVERSIDLGGGGFALVRLPDQVPVEALAEYVRAKGGTVDRFRPIAESEAVGNVRWDYGIIGALEQAIGDKSLGVPEEQIPARLSRTYSEDRVRLAMALLRNEKPVSAILILPDSTVDIERLDGEYFAALHYKRDAIFPVLRENEVKLLLAVPGEEGYQSLNRALQMTRDLYSVRDMAISED